MRDSVSITLRNNMSFDVIVNGHKMIIDAANDFGGSNLGPRPKSLMLVSLAGCTGMDIVALLRKMRIVINDLRIEVEGHITHDYPKHFDHMHIKYIIKGNTIPVDKVNYAIQLSLEKYCGVSYNFEKSMQITHELIVEE
jgi:putative redox protein